MLPLCKPSFRWFKSALGHHLSNRCHWLKLSTLMLCVCISKDQLRRVSHVWWARLQVQTLCRNHIGSTKLLCCSLFWKMPGRRKQKHRCTWSWKMAWLRLLRLCKPTFRKLQCIYSNKCFLRHGFEPKLNVVSSISINSGTLFLKPASMVPTQI